MNDFLTACKEIPGLRYVTSRLELLSAPGRRAMTESRRVDNPEAWEKIAADVNGFLSAMRDDGLARQREEIATTLMSVRDIRGTLARLEAGNTLDDTELFEVKWLALHSQRLRSLLAEFMPSLADRIPDLAEVTAILDPANTGNTSFHIYDIYSPRLAELRGRLRKLCDENRAADAPTQEEDELQSQCVEEEARVRAALTDRLRRYAPELSEALGRIGETDLTRAKALMVGRDGFSLPEATQWNTVITAMFHPEIKDATERRGGRYSRIDITLTPGVTLLTGANMTGKSVVLQTVALIHALAQFGFPVPASKAKLRFHRAVLFSSGDYQSGRGGLSSFAGEMKRIDSILDESARRDCLVLIDEPARTTNPEEGEAIVEAIAEMLRKTGSRSLVTTHYSVEAPGCRRLRVRGLEDCPRNLTDPAEIAARIDYTLVEHTGPTPPREALRIASMIGVNSELIKTAKEKLSNRYNDEK